MRCFKCKNTWVQERPPPEEAPGEETPEAVVSEEVVDTLDDDLEEDLIEKGEGIEEGETINLDDYKPRRVERETGRPAISEKKSKLGNAIGMLVFVLVVLGCGGGAFFFMDQIIDTWPKSARLYNLIGLGEDVPGVGLKLRNVQSERRKEEGDTVLVIEGEVSNVSHVVRDVPLFHGTLTDSAGDELHSWTFSIRQTSLLPGEGVPFKTKVKNLPKGSAGLSITFLPKEAEEEPEAGAEAPEEKAGAEAPEEKADKESAGKKPEAETKKAAKEKPKAEEAEAAPEKKAAPEAEAEEAAEEAPPEPPAKEEAAPEEE